MSLQSARSNFKKNPGGTHSILQARGPLPTKLQVNYAVFNAVIKIYSKICVANFFLLAPRWGREGQVLKLFPA